MILRLKCLSLLLVALLLGACAGTQTIPEPESPGAKLYRAKCTMCHGLPGVKRHTPAQWGQLIVMMEDFMKEKNIEFPLQEKKLIQDYLFRNGK